MSYGKLNSIKCIGNLNQYQTLLAGEDGKAKTVNVNVLNSQGDFAVFRLALSTSSYPDDTEYLEFDLQLTPKTSYERSGIIVGPNQYLLISSNKPWISAMAYGITQTI